MEPVVTNLASNTCDAPISSNCVTFVGTNPPGLCGPQSITAVISSLQTQAANANGCCTGSFPAGNVSGYTGQWVPFTPPSSGTGIGYTWTISNLGTNFTYGGTGTGAENVPQYMWTQIGDLKVRGSFLISINPTIGELTLAPIPLVNVPVVNFPTGFTAAQSILVSTTSSAGLIQAGPYVTITTRAYLTIDFPSGILYLNYSFVDTTKLNITEGIFMGGTQFNLA